MPADHLDYQTALGLVSLVLYIAFTPLDGCVLVSDLS